MPPRPPQFLDLVVTKTADPTTVRVGEPITWTMTVTNESGVDATDVNARWQAEMAQFFELPDGAGGGRADLSLRRLAEVCHLD